MNHITFEPVLFFPTAVMETESSLKFRDGNVREICGRKQSTSQNITKEVNEKVHVHDLTLRQNNSGGFFLPVSGASKP